MDYRLSACSETPENFRPVCNPEVHTLQIPSVQLRSASLCSPRHKPWDPARDVGAIGRELRAKGTRERRLEPEGSHLRSSFM